MQLLQLLLGQRHLPAVEIGSFLIIVVEHLREYLLVCGVAESRRVESGSSVRPQPRLAARVSWCCEIARARTDFYARIDVATPPLR